MSEPNSQPFMHDEALLMQLKAPKEYNHKISNNMKNERLNEV